MLLNSSILACMYSWLRSPGAVLWMGELITLLRKEKLNKMTQQSNTLHPLEICFLLRTTKALLQDNIEKRPSEYGRIV